MDRTRLANRLRRQAQGLAALGTAVRHSFEACEVHELRKLSRRTRATVWVARQVTGKDMKDIRARLQALGSALGERRQLDVAAEDAAEYGIDTAPLLQLFRAADGRISAEVKSKKMTAICRGLVKAANAVERSSVNHLPRTAEALEKRLNAAVNSSGTSKEALHRVRKEARRVRYLLEVLGSDLRILKTLQDYLGRAHDLETMQKLLGTNARATKDERSFAASARSCMRAVTARALREVTRAVADDG